MKSYVAVVLMLFSMAVWGAQWQPKPGKNGVALWTQPHPPGTYLALRLEMRVNAPPSALIAVLRDTARHREWLPKSRTVRLLSKSGPNDDLVYTRLASPWPIQDRELITRSHLSRRADCGLVLTVWAEPDALRLRPDLVRIRESNGRWEALPQQDGTTLVRLETYTDPGSGLPGWLVNPITIETALESFQAIRRMMEAQKRSLQGVLLATKQCPAAP